MALQVIVKIQIPIDSNETVPRALVYDKTRELHFHAPITNELKKFMGKDPKKFAHATITGDDVTINFSNGEAPWQTW